MTRPLNFYDPSDEYDPLNRADYVKAPWTIVCQELDVFEFIHSDGRGGWAEYDPDNDGKLTIGDGEAQGVFRIWDGDSFTNEELKELSAIIEKEFPYDSMG